MYDDRALARVREFTRAQSISFANTAVGPFLEIGPSVRTGAANSPVFDTYPDSFVDSRNLVEQRGLEYLTMDIDPSVCADFVGSVDVRSEILPRNYFGAVMCFSVLEHCPNPFQAVMNIAKALKAGGTAAFLTPWDLRFHGPRPDCWRISDDAYRVLLEPYFVNIKFKFDENPHRPLMPYAIYCEAEKTVSG